MTELKPCKCGKCKEVKVPVVYVDGIPWCEECFDKALDCGDK